MTRPNVEKTKLSVTQYRRLLNYARPHFPKLFAAMGCMVVVSITTGATAWLVQPVLDHVFLEKDLFWLRLLPLLVIVLYGVRGFFRFISSYTMNLIGVHVVRQLRNDMYAHIQTLPLTFFHERRTGELMSRVSNDVSLMEGAVSNLLADVIRENLSIVALLVVLFWRDWQLAAISVLALPLCVAFLYGIGEKLKTLSRRSQEKMADMNAILQETITGARIIKAFGMEDYEAGRYAEENTRFFNVMKKSLKYIELTSPAMEFLGAFALASIVWIGGMRVITGVLTAGEFFSFVAALFMLYGPIRKLSRCHNKIQQALAAAQRAYEILDTEPEPVEERGAVAIPPIQREISFEHVWFRYPRGDWVLKDISLEVPRGQVVAIVGTSGVGKSTLVDLIPRFFDLTKGRITVDGVDVAEASLKSLRAQIGIVTQETFLFNDTVQNNISYGRQDAVEAEVKVAARAAYAHDFIVQMPDGYQTIVGDRGVKLSGGERQRLAIARALIKDPPILILDEATSALDSESEKMVQKALNRLMENRTVFVIAHRFSTIVNADTIIVLHEGEVVEQGPHAVLYAEGGFYRKLYDLQFVEGADREAVG
ncbi:MAG: ABC transporter ATP-binding protein [bacterium]